MRQITKRRLESLKATAALVALACSGNAAAELRFIPYGSAELSYDSNVYRVPSTDTAPVIGGRRARSDSIERYRIGADVIYQLSQQKFYGTFEGRYFDYNQINILDHAEYLFSAGYDWVVGSRLSGVLDFRQERRLASFADRDTAQLLIETERSGGGRGGYLLTPDVRLEGGFKIRDLHSPLPGFPDFSLSENAVTAAAKYVGIARLSAGVAFEYLNGDYSGIPNTSSFNQETGDVTADYVVSDLSAFNLQLGYTQRQDPSQGGNTSGFTGSLAYARQITGKTSANVRVFRRVSSYISGNSTVLETGASGSVTWEATRKITVVASYEYTDGSFNGVPTGSPDAGRHDRYQSGTLNVNYSPLRWLLLRPYGQYQTRTSNQNNASYNDAVFGVEVQVRFDAEQ